MNSIEETYLRGSLERFSAALDEHGLRLTVDRDFAGFKAFVRSLGGIVNSTFDHEVSDLSRAFWIRVEDREGNIVASHADRVFEDDDIMALLQSGRLYRRSPPPGFYAGEVTFHPPSREIVAPFGYSGGLLVAHGVRGKGLVLLPYYTRSIMMLEFGTQFHTGLVFGEIVERKVPQKYYGYPEDCVDLVADGYFPETGKPEQLYLCHISRAESLAAMAALKDHRRYPIDLSPGGTAAAAQ